MKESTYIIKTSVGLIAFNEPKIMGIVNLTPDSFYANSRVIEMNKVVNRVGKMIEEGADIIDLGAISSRPGAEEPSISEELDRLTGPLMAVRAAFPDILISVDTYRVEVLRSCIDLRIDLVNDISGGRHEEEFLDTVARADLPYILMHMLGKPKDMQKKPQYDEVVLDILKYMDERIQLCRSIGIKDMIIDPGFGFGKSIEDNYRLLGGLSSFKMFDVPIMVGLSRKSMISSVLETTSDNALNGTSALHMIALQNGANILRVHDVKEAMECKTLWKTYRQATCSH